MEYMETFTQALQAYADTLGNISATVFSYLASLFVGELWHFTAGGMFAIMMIAFIVFMNDEIIKQVAMTGALQEAGERKSKTFLMKCYRMRHKAIREKEKKVILMPFVAVGMALYLLLWKGISSLVTYPGLVRSFWES